MESIEGLIKIREKEVAGLETMIQGDRDAGRQVKASTLQRLEQEKAELHLAKLVAELYNTAKDKGFILELALLTKQPGPEDDALQRSLFFPPPMPEHARMPYRSGLMQYLTSMAKQQHAEWLKDESPNE